MMDSTYTNDRNNDNDEKSIRHLAICGLHFGTHGKSCVAHDVCGKHVCVGDKLRMRSVNVTLESGIVQQRIGVYSTVGEKNGCLVGFLNPSYYECIEIHNAIQSGLFNITVIRM